MDAPCIPKGRDIVCPRKPVTVTMEIAEGVSMIFFWFTKHILIYITWCISVSFKILASFKI